VKPSCAKAGRARESRRMRRRFIGGEGRIRCDGAKVQRRRKGQGKPCPLFFKGLGPP